MPLLFPAAGNDLFEERLAAALGQTLMALGVPVTAIEKELAEMSVETVYGRTANRSVLGTVNEFTFMREHFLAESDNLLEAALWLARTPIGPMKGRMPADVVFGLLAPRPYQRFVDAREY